MAQDHDNGTSFWDKVVGEPELISQLPATERPGSCSLSLLFGLSLLSVPDPPRSCHLCQSQGLPHLRAPWHSVRPLSQFNSSVRPKIVGRFQEAPREGR